MRENEKTPVQEFDIVSFGSTLRQFPYIFCMLLGT